MIYLGGDTLQFIGNLQNNVDIANNSKYSISTINRPTFDQVTINKDLRVNKNISIGGELLIDGKLNVTGSTTSVSTINLDVSDNLISLNNGLTGTPPNDSGILVNRGDASNAFMGWDESDDKFIFGTTNATSSDTGNLTITPGDIKINNMTLGANLDVCGNLIVDGTSQLNSSLDVSGATLLRGALDVCGNQLTRLGGDLDVCGNASFGDVSMNNLDVSDNLVVGGTSQLSIMTVDPSNNIMIINGDLQGVNIAADTIYANNGYITSNYDISNGFTGEFRFDASYISICVDGSGSSNDWREIEIEKLYQLSMDSTYLDQTIAEVQASHAAVNTAVDYVEQIFGAEDDSTTIQSILTDISGAIIGADTARSNLIATIADASNIIIDVSNAIAGVDVVIANLDASLNVIMDNIETQVIANINVDDISFNSIYVSEMSCDILDVSSNASFGDVSMNNLDVSSNMVVSGTLTGLAISRLDSSMTTVFNDVSNLDSSMTTVFTNVSNLDSSMTTVFNNVSVLDSSMSAVENTIDVSGVTITDISINDLSGVYFSDDASFNTYGHHPANFLMDYSGNLIIKLNDYYFKYNVADVSSGYNGITPP